MKKALLIALCALLPSAFALPVQSQDLIGTWQCDAENTKNARLTLSPKSKASMEATLLVPATGALASPLSYQMTFTATWKLKQNQLFLNSKISKMTRLHDPEKLDDFAKMVDAETVKNMPALPIHAAFTWQRDKDGGVALVEKTGDMGGLVCRKE